jgi:peptide/nickel transport system ATP-binding protein
MSSPLLEVRKLSVDFPTRRGTLLAIDDVSFDDRAGRDSRSWSENPVPESR